MRELLIATGNAHKLMEIRQILAGLEDLLVLSPADLDREFPEPEENGSSFAANALIKAKGYAQVGNKYTLADDSGLVVPALNGDPGIHSARFAGPGSNDVQNRHKLRQLLQSHGLERPEAYFVCCLCLFMPDREEAYYWEGRWHGVLLQQERGKHGFGYDPIFLPTGLKKTAAELKAPEKNRISHRGQALAAFRLDVDRLLSRH